MPEPDACEITLTAPDEQWLSRFTDELVEERLCAAAHLFPKITATYWWRGELIRKTECRASLHTRRSLADVVIDRIQRAHPYNVAGVVVLSLVGGNPAYLDWIIAETRSTTS
jgi:periplasmic divalent cation tolerance protein